MRILQVVPVFSEPFGGPVTVVNNLSKELSKRHQVEVYTTSAIDQKHDGIARVERRDGFKISYFNRNFKQLSYSNLFGQINFSLQLAMAVKSNIQKFDIVHVHSFQQFPDFLLYYYCKKFNIPYVIQTHGSVASTGRQIEKSIYNLFLGNRILRQSQKIIALSFTERKQLMGYGMPTSKIAIIPNAIKLSFDRANIKKQSFRKTYNIKENVPVILYLGRIHRTKGIDLLINAYSKVTEELKNIETLLVIAGPDDGFLTEAKNLVKGLGLGKSVLFTGFLGEYDKLCALIDSDVFVTPSFYGFPVTFLEACAVGTPIITTTLGDTLDWIDGNVGFVTPPTEQALAKSIYSVITNRKLRDSLSEKCFETINDEFSLEKIVKDLEFLYRSAIKQRICE